MFCIIAFSVLVYVFDIVAFEDGPFVPVSQPFHPRASFILRYEYRTFVQLVICVQVVDMDASVVLSPSITFHLEY